VHFPGLIGEFSALSCGVDVLAVDLASESSMIVGVARTLTRSRRRQLAKTGRIPPEMNT
jgi:hypothetical protein